MKAEILGKQPDNQIDWLLLGNVKLGKLWLYCVPFGCSDAAARRFLEEVGDPGARGDDGVGLLRRLLVGCVGSVIVL